MNIEHGGKIHLNIFWRIRQFEMENRYSHFPGYGAETLEIYLRDLEERSQFVTVYDSIFNEPIAFAAWWYLPTLEICREKSWRKPYPRNLDNGDYAYVDWCWSSPNYKSFNLVRRMLMECYLAHPEKHICFHRYARRNEQKFYHRRPLLWKRSEKLIAA